MKSVSSLLILLTFILSSFTVRPINETTTSDRSFKNAFFTDWETNLQWKESSSSTGKVFSFQKQLTQLDDKILSKGYVLAFIKGYNFSKMPMAEKPLSLPFEFFMPEDDATLPISWQVKKAEGQVQVALQIHQNLSDQFQQFGKNIQVRYFVLTPQFLQQHKLTQAQAHQLSYTKLVSLLQVEP
jgi:hypothetical protein